MGAKDTVVCLCNTDKKMNEMIVFEKAVTTVTIGVLVVIPVTHLSHALL